MAVKPNNGKEMHNLEGEFSLNYICIEVRDDMTEAGLDLFSCNNQLRMYPIADVCVRPRPCL